MTVIGSSTTRGDAPAKVRGEARYTVDLVFEGMLHAKILRSPVARGRIVRLDTTRARSMPGVAAVITAADAPSHRHGLAIRDQLLFADGDVHYEGEPVAAVAATSERLARAALAAIDLEIEPEEPVVDLDAAVAPGAPLVHPDWKEFEPVGEDFPRHDNVCAETVSDPAGVDEAFAAADLVIEDEFRTGRQYQAHLEPKAVVAVHEAGRTTIHVSHQYPFNVRDRLAMALGAPAGAIRVVGHHIGGGFGARLDLGVEPYAALLARATGRPVKLVQDRSEDLIAAACRDNAVVRIRSAVTRDGRILGREVDVLFDSGAAAGDGPYLASIPLLLAGGVYRAGPTRVRTRCVYTNTAPTGAFRGVNGTYLVFAFERHMEHIARSLGADPRAFRLGVLMTDGDTLLNGQELPDASILREAFDAIEEVAPWATVGREPLRGRGLAACVWLTNPMPGSVVLKLNEDGTLGVVTGATENGSGAVTMGLTQIAAEQLHVSPESVVVSMPDTDAAPYDAGSQGSRTTHVVGNAIVLAGADLRRQVFEIAAELLEAAPEDLELADGAVGVRGAPGATVDLAEVARTATFTGRAITATASYATPQPSYDPTCATGLLFPTFPTPTYHVHLAEVAVDPVTGRVRVLRYVVAQEVGRVINPDGVYGQIQGGVTQGIGYALYEHLEIGSDGRYRQRSLGSYRLPVAPDIPEVETVLLEHPDPAGPFGAKGVAEPPIVPVAAAVANAVADAVGAPIDRLPITPEVVLDAIERGRR